jgi:hypothetical protein
LQNNFKHFFNDFIIIDSLDSKNGPSNWDIKEEDSSSFGSNKISLIQTSPINSDKFESASSLILRNSLPQVNLHFTISFMSLSNGSIQINFKYKNYQNFLAVQLNRIDDDRGSIKLMENINGNYSIIEELTCEKMLSVIDKCNGYSSKKTNEIEIITIGSKVEVFMNKMQIFNSDVKEDMYTGAKFSLSINNMQNLIIDNLMIGALNEEARIKNQKGVKSMAIVSTSNIKIQNEALKNVGEKSIKTELKYNPEKNKFETISKPSEDSKTESNQKEDYNPSKILTKAFLKEKCQKFEKEEYICNYITNVIINHKINIETNSEIEIVNIIKSNCQSTMKNNLLCEQIINKLEPVSIFSYFRL